MIRGFTVTNKVLQFLIPDFLRTILSLLAKETTKQQWKSGKIYVSLPQYSGI